MTTIAIDREAPAQAWRAQFESLETEIRDGVELEVEGSLPAELQGTLYRIGPARHDVYGERYRHWFDGDGMVHALRLGGGRAQYRNRFVETTKKREEDAAHRRLYSGFATPPAGGPLERLRRGRIPMSAANTNVVACGGHLLALWEGDRPWRLDPVTLATIGEDDLGGVLAAGDPVSAHPHWDPISGELWNFGVRYGRKAVLSVYRTRADGATERVTQLPLPIAAMVHDFAVTPTRVVVVVVPYALPTVPVGMLTGASSYGDSLRWRPQDGTRVAVIDRASGEVRWYRTEPFLMFHTVNAYDEGADVVVDLCAYPDTSLMRWFKEVMRGTVTTRVAGHTERLRLGAGGAVTTTRLPGGSIEFPRVATGAMCAEHRRIYAVAWSDDGYFPRNPAALDLDTGALEVAPMRDGEFAGECVPVSKAGATSESDVWLLTLVLDAVTRRSEVRVLDGGDLSAPPVAVVPLPHMVPAGFHGNWVPTQLHLT
ncbi:MAG TPA: carotenoid oxygenase family protein [Candidatus Dormibacteraeota bacterium]|nr:carotenoid oxygenase family protein [Candidatus Dormibacteraeota bacterium]